MANKLNEVKHGDGVYEWARYSYNIGTGCSNDCRYCYAYNITQEIARKDGRDFSRADWQIDRTKPWKAHIHESVNDIVMFPSMHDITPTNLQTYIATLRNILKADNPVVIVTKPRLECVRAICEAMSEYKDYMLFRMTITSLDPDLSRLWEPGAPLPANRLEALRFAYDAGFQTSVSVEPMIDSVGRTIELYNTVLPYLTEDIWFGKMNDIDSRVSITSDTIRNGVQVVKGHQSDANIRLLYDRLKDSPRVEWKDSIRKVIGIKKK